MSSAWSTVQSREHLALHPSQLALTAPLVEPVHPLVLVQPGAPLARPAQIVSLLVLPPLTDHQRLTFFTNFQNANLPKHTGVREGVVAVEWVA